MALLSAVGRGPCPCAAGLRSSQSPRAARELAPDRVPSVLTFREGLFSETLTGERIDFFTIAP